jgi:anthranilate phosphoribosyltransferase
MATVVPLDKATRADEMLDVCGTGGDGLNTFNISTTVAILCAAAGVTVAKHGNRAITSKSGSADVLDALGIPTDLSPTDAAAAIAEHGFAFLFAPLYHPAFKHIAPARALCAERGQRTLFNFLGPLLNPARPTAQLIGVPRIELTKPMAKVLQHLGIQRGMVVCGRVGEQQMDELSTLGENVIAEFYHDRGFATSTLNPADLPLPSATLDQLAGGDAQINADIIRAILNGKETGPKRDAVLLNAGAALFVAGKADSISTGMEFAGAVIDEGHATEKLLSLAR